MQWDNSDVNGKNNKSVDPSQSEIIGFTAGLCVTGIPRVVACPWIVYDLPICHIVPEVIKRALEKRATGEHHPWARALRDTIVLGLQQIDRSDNARKFGLYDIANLMLFGTP